MGQGSGLLNNAPNPIPGGGTNPAGANVGLPNINMGTGLPGSPFQSPMGPVLSHPNAKTPAGLTPGAVPSFPANGVPAGGTNPLNNLSSGTGFTPQELAKNPGLYGDLGKMLVKSYGKGVGMQIFNMLTQGMFNPQVAQKMIDAMQPNRTRGENAIQNAFGQQGARFSSAAAVGLGDFESQFALGENSVLSQMFMHAQDQQLNLLENILPTTHAEAANSGSFWHDLLAGLETAGGAALEFVPGMQGLGTAMIGQGMGGLLGGNKGGGGNPTTASNSAPWQGGNQNPTSGIPLPSDSAISDSTWQQIILGSSGANAVDGTPGQGG